MISRTGDRYTRNTTSHAKSIYRQVKLNVGKLGGMLPPYGEQTEKTIRLQIGK